VSFDDLAEWVSEGLGAAAPTPGSIPLEASAGLKAGALSGALRACDGSQLSREDVRRIETDFKYEGYLAQQEKQMERMKRAESHRIPEWFDYRKVSGLSREVVEKLTKVRPLTLGQALRIPGITPAAVSLVNVYIEIFQRRATESR
jgi:tRNA U34 5-carboxymethylaminomethyl modifying enzyme MnmG/GidA